MDIEEIFYNKELSDAIRDIVLNSPCTMDKALRLIKQSRFYERDVELIKNLLNHGIREDKISMIIHVINS